MEIFQFNRTRFIKNIDPKTFPLCRKVLLEIIKRAWYISKLYKTATTTYRAKQLAEIDYGWKLSDDNEFLDVKWHEGEHVLTAIKNNEELEDLDEKVIHAATVINPIMKIIYFYLQFI